MQNGVVPPAEIVGQDVLPSPFSLGDSDQSPRPSRSFQKFRDFDDQYGLEDQEPLFILDTTLNASVRCKLRILLAVYLLIRWCRSQPGKGSSQQETEGLDSSRIRRQNVGYSSRAVATLLLPIRLKKMVCLYANMMSLIFVENCACVRRTVSAGLDCGAVRKGNHAPHDRPQDLHPDFSTAHCAIP